MVHNLPPRAIELAVPIELLPLDRSMATSVAQFAYLEIVLATLSVPIQH